MMKITKRQFLKRNKNIPLKEGSCYDLDADEETTIKLLVKGMMMRHMKKDGY